MAATLKVVVPTVVVPSVTPVVVATGVVQKVVEGVPVVNVVVTGEVKIDEGSVELTTHSASVPKDDWGGEQTNEV